jgi:proteasome lid subunit RPN8/RPN11
MKYIYVRDQNFIPELDELLPESKIAEIYSQALLYYPDECCGLILKEGIRPCVNILNRLHQADPVNYPQTASKGFVFSAEDALFLSKSIYSDNPAKIIYHSHPNVGAYFSNEDKNNALFDDEPIYQVDHLVIDVQANTVLCSKLFRYIGGNYELIVTLPGNNDLGGM